MRETLRPDVHIPWPMENDSDGLTGPVVLEPKMDKDRRPKIRGSKYKTPLPVPKPKPPPQPK